MGGGVDLSRGLSSLFSESAMVEVQMRNLGTSTGGDSGNEILNRYNIISTALGALPADGSPR
jgi:hypothetical protein